MPSLPAVSLLGSRSLGAGFGQPLAGLLHEGCSVCPLAGTACWGPQALEMLSPGHGIRAGCCHLLSLVTLCMRGGPAVLLGGGGGGCG